MAGTDTGGTMQISRRKLLNQGIMSAVFLQSRSLLGLAKEQFTGLTASGTHGRTLAQGPFQPTWESLKRYQAPEWFRDAKLGIWAHWSAQCVHEDSDWYARQMYTQGHPQYDHHLNHY